MKILKILIAILIVMAIPYFTYHYSYNRGYYRAVTDNTFEQHSSQAIRDYPFVDIYFDKDSDWLIVNRQNLFTDNELFSIIQDAKIIEANKEFFYVNIFPVGRGVTPTGEIYIYRNGELIKSVPYLDFVVLSQMLKDKFKDVNEGYIHNLLKADLPSPI